MSIKKLQLPLPSVKPKRINPYLLRGLFSAPIPYEDRNPSGNWEKWFGNFEGQRYFGRDMSTCWSHAGNEKMETEMEFLAMSKLLAQEDFNWFKDKGYVDADGDFFFSRRFIPTLSGVRDNGNDESEFWRLTLKYGAIPYHMLSYDNPNEDFFDHNAITQEMLALGKEFLTHIKIQYEELGKRFSRRDITMIRGALKQSPLQIGIPIPKNVFDWNEEFIKWDGSMPASHSVELYGVNDKGEYLIFDQYEPHLKRLSSDYYIPIITRSVLTPIVRTVKPPAPELNIWQKVWTAVMNEWFLLTRPT